MARTSQRLSTGTGPTPTHKRAVSSTAAPASEAKKAKTDKVTPLKSQYFDDYSHAENEDPLSSEDDAVSEFGGEGDEEGDGDERSEPADDDDYDSEAEAREPRKKAASRKTASILAGTKASTSNEIWREGVSAGLGPGNQVVIKKPKARTAGKTPYRDETIHPNTFFFLADLKQNNDRQWLKSELHLSRQHGFSCSIRAIFCRRVLPAGSNAAKADPPSPLSDTESLEGPKSSAADRLQRVHNARAVRLAWAIVY